MPQVFRTDGFVVFFYSNEGTEPPHVHVKCGKAMAKYWLDPVSMASVNRHMQPQDLARATELVKANEALCLVRWKEYFDDGK